MLSGRGHSAPNGIIPRSTNGSKCSVGALVYRSVCPIYSKPAFFEVISTASLILCASAYCSQAPIARLCVYVSFEFPCEFLSLVGSLLCSRFPNWPASAPERLVVGVGRQAPIDSWLAFCRGGQARTEHTRTLGNTFALQLILPLFSDTIPTIVQLEPRLTFSAASWPSLSL